MASQSVDCLRGSRPRGAHAGSVLERRWVQGGDDLGSIFTGPEGEHGCRRGGRLPTRSSSAKVPRTMAGMIMNAARATA